MSSKSSAEIKSSALTSGIVRFIIFGKLFAGWPLITISLLAASLGATSIERHVTLDRTMYGSDQAASLEYSGMDDLTSSLNKIIKSLGEEKLGFINEEEKKIAKKLRAHLTDE